MPGGERAIDEVNQRAIPRSLYSTKENMMRSLFDASLTRRRVLGQAGAGAAGLVAAGGLSLPMRSATQEPVTLSWLTDLPQAELIATSFAELNPGITVEVETVTFREVFQQNQDRLGSFFGC